MDTVSILQLVILVVLLLLSAFFSSAETALTTVNKIKMKSMAEDGDKRAQCVLKGLSWWGSVSGIGAPLEIGAA